MKHNGIFPARKLEWDEISCMLENEIRQILDKPVNCRAASEDQSYWSGAAVNYRFSIPELEKLLQDAHAAQKDWEETIPYDSDGSYSLGMGLSVRLLRRALHAEWESEYFTEQFLWLLNYCETPEKKAKEDCDILKMSGAAVNTTELKTRKELLEYLFENGPTHASLMDFCDSYRELYHNELCWPYPISDGKHLGTFLVPVREGILSLPYDEADKDDYEIFRLEDIKSFDAESMTDFLESWNLFSNDLKNAMESMQKFLQKKEFQNESI